MEEAEAVRLAEAEGLTLMRSANNATGFTHVSFDGRSVAKQYRASICHTDNGYLSLGMYASAPEAALTVARYFGPEKSRVHAAHRKPQSVMATLQPGPSDSSCSIANAACSDDDDEEATEPNAIIEVETIAVGKRKRTAPGPDASWRHCPATSMTSKHNLPSDNGMVEDGVAYINIAVPVPVGMRMPTSVTVEWH